MNWQPIETAPCDDHMVIIYWENGMMSVEDLDHDSDPMYWQGVGATHWMPLPEPPNE
jgi:hypothetical protein